MYGELLPETPAEPVKVQGDPVGSIATPLPTGICSKLESPTAGPAGVACGGGLDTPAGKSWTRTASAETIPSPAPLRVTVSVPLLIA